MFNKIKILTPFQYAYSLLPSIMFLFCAVDTLFAQQDDLINSFNRQIETGNNLVISQEASKTLTKAILYITNFSVKHPSSDDLEVKVTSFSGALLAQTTISLKSQHSLYKNSYQYQLEILLPNVEKQFCKDYLVSISKKSNQNRPLTLQARVELYFSDNYILAADKDNIRFNKELKEISFKSY